MSITTRMLSTPLEVGGVFYQARLHYANNEATCSAYEIVIRGHNLSKLTDAERELEHGISPTFWQQLNERILAKIRYEEGWL